MGSGEASASQSTGQKESPNKEIWDRSDLENISRIEEKDYKPANRRNFSCTKTVLIVLYNQTFVLCQTNVTAINIYI